MLIGEKVEKIDRLIQFHVTGCSCQLVAWFLLFEGTALLWDHSGRQINSSKKKNRTSVSPNFDTAGVAFLSFKASQWERWKLPGKVPDGNHPKLTAYKTMGWPKTKPSTDTGLVRGGAAIGAPGAPTTWEERNLETPEKGKNHSRLVPLFFQKTSLERSSTIPDLKNSHIFSTSESGDIWN